MVMRVGCADEDDARQHADPFGAELRSGRKRRRRWERPRHGQATHAAIVDTAFAAISVGRGRGLIRDAVVAENAKLRDGFGCNLCCAKACN